MQADRPAKTAVRQLWVEAVRIRKSKTPPDMPFYITLPGAGTDIQVLIDAGLIAITESGAIADSDNHRVIAVEQDSRHVAALKNRFPGLRVVNKKIEDLLQGTTPYAWPDETVRRDFRATVVNLDFNQGLRRKNGGWPVVGLIAKIAELHRNPQRIDWTLLLTLQGSVALSEADQKVLAEFLGQMLNSFGEFAEHCSTHLIADALIEELSSAPAKARLVDTDEATQAQILLASVPALIAHELHGDGWLVETLHNARYGGLPDAASMVTFVVSLTQPGRPTNAGLLAESLASVASSPTQISAEGKVQECAPLP